MEKFKTIFKKIVNKETVLYVVFGVLTTLVNFVAFKLFTMAFDKLVSSARLYFCLLFLCWR